MTKKHLVLLFLCFGFFGYAQKKSKEFRSKIFLIKNDSILVDSLSINPYKFKVLDSVSHIISSRNYQIDFSKSQLIINSKKYRKITVEYYLYPNFITKTYIPYDKKLIVPTTKNTLQLYSLKSNKKATDITLFDGLKTKGFIVRGVTSGNNQNAVTNAELNLEISGKLSKDVTLRANIYDTNIPLQENGYSQNITDFDRIFIEMYSKKWRVKAGDISLKNKQSHFLHFEKQVAGLEVEASVNKNTQILASGAVVRGKFSSYKFTGTEGNQGPYKVYGANNTPGIIIVGGSEKVFVNGNLLKRGDKNDYLIDYNLAEIRFNTTYPITKDMRIVIEFQYSDRNYTRFITYEKATYKADKFSISGYFYNENDAKNSPLQQNLSNSQKQILANAGNNSSLMVSPSAFLDTYSENKILYKKTMVGTLETFEYSTDENTDLYTVTFTNVGTNKGNYILDSTIAIGTIYKFVGINLGDYNPVIQLIAPEKLQIGVLTSSFTPTKKTSIETEIAFSNQDANLFSTIDNQKNKGLATRINWQQVIIDSKWQLKSTFDYQFIHQNFKTVQRFQSIEFQRDWNLVNPTGNQQETGGKLSFQKNENEFISYNFKQLSFANFIGNKHELTSNLRIKKTVFSTKSSFLNNNSTIEKNNFLRAKANITHFFSKSWLGAFTQTESNERINKINQNFINTSHKFNEYEGFIGIGDSTKVFVKFGVNYRTNDSIKNNQFTQVNNRKTLYVQSKIIQNKRSNLSIYANYRRTQNKFTANEKSLNSKIVYNQRLFQNFLILGTTYETSSGNVARQDYVYIKTEPGQGFYTWIDYNNDGIKDLDEFEIAQYQDQASYLRVPLPNLHYIATQRAKWQQTFSINFKKWQQQKGVKKMLSHFYNQSFLTVANEQERTENSFHLNPFNFDKNKLISLQYNLRNNLYFNRGLQKHSLIFTYGTSKNKQQFFTGNQENNTNIHQLEYQHKLGDFWLIDLLGNTSTNHLETENFNNRNYFIKAKKIAPKISFLYNKNHKLSAFYTLVAKANTIQNQETLTQQTLGIDYFLSTKKGGLFHANINLINNQFNGNPNSPVAYQLLEGLQVGKNYTWNLMMNKKINSFLQLNINYLGRKSNNTKTIHTGTIELKALF